MVVDEFKKISLDEKKTFLLLINCYLKNSGKYTTQIIVQRLLDLGYSNLFVNYLIGNGMDNEQSDSNIQLDDNQSDDDKPPDDNQLNEQFVMRENQKVAIVNTIDQNFKSGIHNQIMGAGKSYIILNLIQKHFEIVGQNKIYLLLCDRQEILRKMFFDDENKICQKKITKWKKSGIIDLTKFDVKEYVHTKIKDIYQIINKQNRTKPMLMICNNAFIRVNDISQINKNQIALILMDECHSVSGNMFYHLLTHFKFKLKIPIIGFSATPLRPKSEEKLRTIFSINNKINKIKSAKLNIISQYGLFDAIKDEIVLPLNYHFIEVRVGKTKNDIPVTNYDITKNIINQILPNLPYKKLICWCRTIKLLKKWYQFFQAEFPKMHIYMSSHQDNLLINEEYNCDADSFYHEKKMQCCCV